MDCFKTESKEIKKTGVLEALFKFRPSEVVCDSFNSQDFVVV